MAGGSKSSTCVKTHKVQFKNKEFIMLQNETELIYLMNITDPSKPLWLTVGSSSYSLWAVLTHNGDGDDRDQPMGIQIQKAGTGREQLLSIG